jgi:uncharacterized protein involved in exopolysaccharide biosynthesis
MSAETLDLETSTASPRPLDLFDLWGEFRRRWWQYVGVVFVFGVIGALAGLYLPKTYRVDVTFLPVDTRSASGGLASMLGNLGGLASMAGLAGLDRGKDSVTAVAMLQSRELTRDFVHQNGLMPELFWKYWDADRKDWEADLSPKKVPTDWDVYRLFEKRVRRVNEDKRTGLVTLSIQWRDRQLAADWANGLLALADKRMRERAIAESEARIKLLNLELDKGPAIGVQQGIYRLIEAEINKIVLAKSATDFSFRIIDPGVVPDEDAQVRPRPAMYTLIGLMAGGALALAWLLTRLLTTGRRRPA